MTTYGPKDSDELDSLNWIVWNIEVLDPAALTKPEVGGRTEQAMTEMAGSLGCVFVQCWDDDTVDGVPYYSWHRPAETGRASRPRDLESAVETLLHFSRKQDSRVQTWVAGSAAGGWRVIVCTSGSGRRLGTARTKRSRLPNSAARS